MEDALRENLAQLTLYYAVQAKCYQDMEKLAVDHARALVAPALDMKQIQELLELRLEALEAMEGLVRETQASQGALCGRMKVRELKISELERRYGHEPEFIRFKDQMEIRRQILERMIRLDQANEQVMRERMEEMKKAGRGLQFKARAGRAYRGSRMPSQETME